MTKPYPAFKIHGDCTEITLKVVVDTREQDPLPIQRLPFERGTLVTGDYSVRGLEHLIAIERKSIPDLCQSCTRERERFERELHRLRGFRFRRLLVVGRPAEIATSYGGSSPKAILHSLSAFEARYDVPVVWSENPDEAGRRVESWCWWFAREVTQDFVALRKPVEAAVVSVS